MMPMMSHGGSLKGGTGLHEHVWGHGRSLGPQAVRIDLWGDNPRI